MNDPYDEKQIGYNDKLFRRIHKSFVKRDDSGNKYVSTQAFSLSSTGNRGMSVDIESPISNAGVETQAYLLNFGKEGVAYLFAGEVRKLNMMVGYDRLPENPYHGEVWPISLKRNFSSTENQKFSEMAVLIE